MGKKLDDIGDFWSAISQSYTDRIDREGEQRRNQAWLDKMHAIIGDRKNLRILDVATGAGMFAILLSKEGHRVTGIDYAEGMIAQARSNAERFGSDAEFIRMDTQNLEFEDGTFDLIVSRNVLWILEDPRKAYSEWLRVLKPHGEIYTEDGNWLLHDHDEDYGRQWKENDMHGSPQKYVCGVDTDIIHEIASSLSVATVERPQWDFGVLMEMGVSTVKVDTDGRDFYKVEKENGTKYLHYVFDIYVRK